MPVLPEKRLRVAGHEMPFLSLFLEEPRSLTSRMPSLQKKTRPSPTSASKVFQKHVRLSAMSSDDSSREDKKEKKRELLNKLLNNSTTITIVRSFCVPPEKAPSLITFYEIARREAGSRGFSTTLIKAIEEYNQRHELGNPQHKLTPYIDENAPSPMKVLCLHLNGAMSDGTVHCSRAGMWIKSLRCYTCPKNQLRKKDPQKRH